MEEIREARLLFEKVEEILDDERRLSQLRGESYNVFRLLGLEGNEAGFHTKFLYDLLNPRGSHDKGAIFFEKFVQILNRQLPSEKKIPDFSNVNIQAKKEIYVGPVNHYDKEGGIIDLYFETDSFALAIENKIYSNLGYLQLERYRKFLSNKVSKYPLLVLLSPFGSHYDGELKENEDFFQLKYSQLIPWLEYCMEKSADFPILRETIKQYIISVKGISGMLTSKEMNEKLKKLIYENYEVSRQIADTFNQAKDLRILRMYEIVLSNLDQSFLDSNFLKDFSIQTINSMYWGFWISNKNWRKWNIKILFQGNSELVKGMIPTISFDPVSDNDWNNVVNLFSKGAKRFPPDYMSQIQYPGKFKKIDHLINSSKSPEQMASEMFDYVLETIQKLEKEIHKLEQILSGH